MPAAVPTRPFRFGVQTTITPDRTAWVEQARRAEALGYSTLTMPDHFKDQFAPIPALMAAADATSTLRVGALVHGNDYKHPVVLAKELATIDVLSEGRLDIGLGSGWERIDYDHAGLTYDRAGVRVDRFAESIAVIKGIMGGGAFSYDGEHYTITDYEGVPAPVQTPHPPLLIGGGGPRVLGIAAREADIVGINPTLTAGVIDQRTFGDMTAASVDDKHAVVVEAAGSRLDDIELHVRTFLVTVTADAGASRTDAVEATAAMTSMSPDEVERSPFALVGPPPMLADLLRERRERWGFSFVSVGAAELEAFAPVVAELAGT